MKVTLDIPYPSLDGAINSSEYGYKLFMAYAGVVSEFSASTRYSYQSFILPKNISKIIEEIGIVEMRHLEILATLIKQSGLIPYIVNYEDKFPIPWSSNFVNYTTNYIELLNDNILSEQQAIMEYKRLVDLTNNTQTKNILNRIILDEKHHIKIFENLLDKAKKMYN